MLQLDKRINDFLLKSSPHYRSGVSFQKTKHFIYTLIFSGILLLILIAKIIITDGIIPAILPSVVFFVVLVMLAVAFAGKPKLAANLLGLIFLGLMVFSMYANIRGSDVPYYMLGQYYIFFVIIVFTAMFTSKKVFLLSVLVSLATTIHVFYATHNEIPEDIRDISEYGFFIYEIMLLMIALFSYFFTKFIDRAIADISEKSRKAEERSKRLKELNATRDKFFSIVAHDLKGPFNAILGFSAILSQQADKNDPKRTKQLADTIKHSADNTYKLLENLLEWGQSQTDRIKFEREKINLHNFLLEIIGVFESQSAKKDIMVFNQVPKDITVNADRNMLNTILRNLLRNAVKYTTRGGSVAVGIKQSSDAMHIFVSDTGSGISPDNLKRLFDISEKFSEKGTENEAGTGLGLILCKEFVEKHGGKIWAESAIGQGSTFTFSLHKA